LPQISGLLNKHNDLQDNKLAAQNLQTEYWMHLVMHAENAFIGAGVLEMMAEAQQVEKEQEGEE
jgi:hypothetical protein